MERLPRFPRSQYIAQARRSYELAKDRKVVSISSFQDLPLVTGRTLDEGYAEGPWTYRRDVIMKDAQDSVPSRASSSRSTPEQTSPGITVLQRMSQVTYEEAEEQMHAMLEGRELYRRLEAQCLQYCPTTGKIVDLHEGKAPLFDLGYSSNVVQGVVGLTDTVLQENKLAARDCTLAFLRWLKKYTDKHVTPLLKYLDPVFANDTRKRQETTYPWLQRHVTYGQTDILSPYYTLTQVSGQEKTVFDPTFSSAASDTEVTTIVLCFGMRQVLHLRSPTQVDVELQPGDVVFIANCQYTFWLEEILYRSVQHITAPSWAVVCSQNRIYGELARQDAENANTTVPLRTTHHTAEHGGNIQDDEYIQDDESSSGTKDSSPASNKRARTFESD